MRMKPGTHPASWRGAMRILWVCALAITSFSHALIIVGGAEPVSDMGWPKGAVEVANLASRFRYIEGPPFGGGRYVFEYNGDAQALNEALQKFAAVRAPKLELAIHDGTRRPSVATADEQERQVNWSFTVWNPESFYSLVSDVRNLRNAQRGFFVPVRSATVPAPRMDVYTGQIDGDKVRIPEGLAVTDERAAVAPPAKPESAALSGVVYDMTTGKPISGASVSAVPNSPGQTASRLGPVTTNEDGEFQIEGASPGGHFVIVQADGYAPRKAGNYFDHDDLYRSAARWKPDDKGLAVYLSKSAVVAGRVTDSNGNPVAGIEIHARRPFGIDGEPYALEPNPAPGITDAEGRFRIDGLPEGIVYLLCWGEWYSTSAFQPYPVPAKNVRLTVVRAASVKGRLVDALGDPVAGEVSLTEAADRIGRFATEARPGEDGLFEILNVPPGEYVLSSAGMRYWGQEDPTAQTVVLKPGETAQVTLAAPPQEGH